MKMKFGAIVVDGRGKIGGHVASKNRGGAYLRTKVTPVNAQTASQLSIRNRFTNLSQAWRGLTEEQRAAWNAAVSDYARTNIFGDLHQPTGFNLFQRLNNNLQIVGETALDTPPMPESVGEVVISTLVVDTDDSEINLTLVAAVPADTSVKVFATAPVSAGRSFVKSQYRLIRYATAASGPVLPLTEDYIAKFGSFPAAGQKVFLKTVAVNTNTGQEGTPSSISAIAAIPTP